MAASQEWREHLAGQTDDELRVIMRSFFSLKLSVRLTRGQQDNLDSVWFEMVRRNLDGEYVPTWRAMKAERAAGQCGLKATLEASIAERLSAEGEP